MAALLATVFTVSTTGQSAAPPRIDSIVSGLAGTILSWNDTVPDHAYTVQTWNGVGAPFWRAPRTGFPWPLEQRQWTDTEQTENSRRFYRVVAVPKTARGLLISVTPVVSYTQFEINLYLTLANIPLTANYGVQVQKLVYETIDPVGVRTIASGALALPDVSGKSWPLVSYQHGTVAARDEAPSAPGTMEQLLGVLLAGSGYAAALPDYLGLGDSPGIHPYHHAASEATAAVDMLRASRAYCQGRGIVLNGQLFLVGYSQGGHATMALHRELEEYHAVEFPVTASAPMAGAYDMSGMTGGAALAGEPMPNPYYFALLLSGYQSVYHLADELGDLLAPPYNVLLPPLLDGNHSGGEINAVLPNDITEALDPGYLAAMRANPEHPMWQALRDNDLYRWTPRAPMRLYHCAGDGDVQFANSQVALASFHERGATHVVLIDPDPTADHGDCVLPAMLDAKKWFDSLRR